jgi:hypothetical protein
MLVDNYVRDLGAMRITGRTKVNRFRTRSFILSAVLSLIVVSPIAAEDFQFFHAERKSGYLEINSFSDQLSRDWASLRAPLRDRELGVGTSLYLKYVGSVYHRRLLEWDAAGRVTLKRRRFTNSTVGFTERFSEYLQDYSLGITVFKDRGLSGRLYASRNTSTADADFSASTNVNTRSYGGALTYVKGHLVQTLSASNNKYVSEGVVDNEEKRSVVVYDAVFRKNRLSSSANYEYNDIEFVTSSLMFSGHSARVQNYFNIDERGWHTISLSGNYYERNGSRDNKNGEIGIGTSQRFTSNLESSGSYLFRRNEVDRVISETSTAAGNLQHQLFQSLTSRLALEAYRTSFNQGRETEYHPTASFQYRKTTFFGSMRLRYLLGYRKHDERFTQGAGAFSRQRQDNFLYTPGAPLILSATTIDTVSIVVSSPDSSVLFAFQSGIDYQVVETGSRVELVVLLTGSIQSGDSLNVTYKESFSGSFTFEEAENRYGVTFEIRRNLLISADRTSQRQILLSGAPPNQLDNTRADQVSASWLFKDARLKAEYQRRKTIRNPYKRRALSGQLSRAIGRSTTLSTTTTYSVTDFTDQTGTAKLFSVTGVLWRRFGSHLSSRLQGSVLKRVGRRDDGNSWVFSNVTRYDLRLLLGELRVDYYNRRVDLVGDEDRLNVKISIKRRL